MTLFLLSLASCDKPGQRKAVPIGSKGRGVPWAESSPAQTGMDAVALKAFSDAVGGNGVVVRHDALVYAWGEPYRALDVASASKPVMVHFVFKAIEDGKISSMDEPVAKWVPDLAVKDTAITWRHLTNQTSCYGVTESPGTAYDYNDYQTALLWSLIYEKVNREPLESIAGNLLGPQLFDLIGAQDRPHLRLEAEGKVKGRLIISARDFARIGAVYLHGGKWQGRQVIAAESVRQALQSPLPLELPRTKGVDAPMLPGQQTYGGGKNQEEHLGCYSFMWWVNTQQKLWPHLPADSFAAVGNGGVKVLLVVPSLDLIVSWNDADLSPQPLYTVGRQQMDKLLAKLALAVLDVRNS